jgi:dolichol-phosphate mannosyltransferase
MQAGLSPESVGLEQELVAVPTGPLCISKSGSAPSLDLSIVLPTLNEARNLERMLPLLDSILRDLDVSYEIIVVDDDSLDRSWEKALTVGQQVPSLRVMRRTGERGLATAVIRGWQAARGAVLGVIDADLQHPPEVIPMLWRQTQSGAELAVASRRVPGGGVSDWSLRRRIVSLTAHAIGLVLLPDVFGKLADPLSGCFLVRRDALAGITMNPRGCKILIEVIARSGTGRIVEVGYVFRERTSEKSKASWRVYRDYLAHLATLRLARFRRLPRTRKVL